VVVCGVSWVMCAERGRTRRIGWHSERYQVWPMHVILLVCRCRMGVLRRGKNRRRRGGLRRPSKLSRHDRARLCRQEGLENGQLLCPL
jgi:hypothetical protein